MPSTNWSRPALPDRWQTGGFGLYVHWPFCQAKCPYCDFNSHVVSAIDQKRWKAAYLSEIARAAAETPGRVLSTIFFGGGTPSLMDPDVVAAVIEEARARWKTANDLEVTLEANPTSVEAGRFAAYRDGGVTRVSLGLQALNDPDLKALGRLHSAAEGRAALDTAMATFDRVSFDLIYARQNQTLEVWDAELRTAVDIGASHMSLYQLTIEPGTAFGDRFARGTLRGLPDEDLGADLFHTTQAVMEAAGFDAYEVSNHAKDGEFARHNLIYWRGGDYVGIGPGAHGRLTLNGVRYATDTLLAPTSWLSLVEKTGSGEADRTPVGASDDVAERLMMGLRLSEGILLSDPATQHILSNTNKINSLKEIEMIEVTSSHLRVTKAGRPVLNAILRDLLA
ncbi:MAG: coproporphyrinogen III oxidase [Rhodobacteraceae bacterium]|nr:coproporphyrinogen III oxidase [Paracoccaceae bacterium]